MKHSNSVKYIVDYIMSKVFLEPRADNIQRDHCVNLHNVWFYILEYNFYTNININFWNIFIFWNSHYSKGWFQIVSLTEPIGLTVCVCVYQACDSSCGVGHKFNLKMLGYPITFIALLDSWTYLALKLHYYRLTGWTAG